MDDDAKRFRFEQASRGDGHGIGISSNFLRTPGLGHS